MALAIGPSRGGVRFSISGALNPKLMYFTHKIKARDLQGAHRHEKAGNVS